jgi:hypothetical protein
MIKGMMKGLAAFPSWCRPWGAPGPVPGDIKSLNMPAAITCN